MAYIRYDIYNHNGENILQQNYEIEVNMDTIPVWLQIVGYMIPLVISVGSAVFIYKKDKAIIKKTGVETDEVPVESDRQDSKLSLEWAIQFKNEMETIRKENKELRDELTVTQKQMTDLIILNTNQNARIIKLETDIGTLTKENALLKRRVKELEDENRKLKEC